MHLNSKKRAKQSSTGNFLLLILAAIIGAAALITAEHEVKKVYLVEIADTEQPGFPDRCVICGQPRGELLTTMRIGDEIPIADFAFYKVIKRPSQGGLLQIPIHDSCARGLRNRLLKRALLCVLALVALTTLCLYLRMNIWITIFAALLIFVPLISRQLSEPPPIEYSRIRQQYVLMFPAAQYAGEFARMHNAEVVEVDYRGGDYIRSR